MAASYTTPWDTTPAEADPLVLAASAAAELVPEVVPDAPGSPKLGGGPIGGGPIGGIMPGNCVVPLADAVLLVPAVSMLALDVVPEALAPSMPGSGPVLAVPF